jgi:hypothetical protein
MAKCPLEIHRVRKLGGVVLQGMNTGPRCPRGALKKKEDEERGKFEKVKDSTRVRKRYGPFGRVEDPCFENFLVEDSVSEEDEHGPGVRRDLVCPPSYTPRVYAWLDPR